MARLPVNVPPQCKDEERLEALRGYAVLDTAPERAFDDIARLAGKICRAPVAVISLIDESRQWFKSEIGLGVRQTPLDVSICAHALLQSDLFIVPDTLKDERFRNNPLVTGEPHLRFYAGALLETQEGHQLGTLCVLDYVPRELDDVQKDSLRTLARQVMAQLELRRALAGATRTEAALRRANTEAEAANRAKDQFLGFLSHELRTPLTPALLTAASMAADESLSAEVRSDAAIIRRNIEMTTRLADDLLDVTRIASGKLELRIETADAHESLKGGISLCEAEAAAKGVRLTLDLRAGRYAVTGDPLKLQQVWCNLVKNAIKFTPPSGSVAVRSSDAPGGRLRVEVTDSGVGVDPSLLPRMFNLYEQGDRAVTREHAGLGLGLTICKGIVDAHGGTIAAVSEGRGRGTTMIVELPATTPQAKVPPSGTPSPGREGPPPSLKILLVDDHEDTLRAMSRLVSKLSHRVTTASSVSTALSVAAADEFDLLISDVGLPDGTGLDLMRELLKRRPVPPIRGIALTGYGTEADIRKTREAGFSAHLTKPINFKDLEAAIRGTGS